MEQQNIQNLADTSILILGFSAEGQSTYRWLRQHFPHKLIGIADRNAEVFSDFDDDACRVFTGSSYLEALKFHQVVFRSPGIPWFAPELEAARNQGVAFTSQTQWFFDTVASPTVAVTGTKGKSTTSSLIGHLLNTAGKTAVVVGNIGTPLFESPTFTQQQRETITVAELSAHQLVDASISPSVAVLLPVVSDHLDYYPNLVKYHQAKQRITAFQSSADQLFAVDTPTNRVLVADSQAACSFINQTTENKWSDILAVFTYQAPHMRMNATVALEVVSALGCTNQEVLKHGLATFRGLPHRLEIIPTKTGVTYVNDSLATTPEACMAAVRCFPDKPIILLVGGFDRSIPYEQLARFLSEQNTIKHLLLFPETGKLLAELLEAQTQAPSYTLVRNKNDVRGLLQRLQTPGDVVLLSPAAASFNWFADYRDRGEWFASLATS